MLESIGVGIWIIATEPSCTPTRDRQCEEIETRKAQKQLAKLAPRPLGIVARLRQTGVSLMLLYAQERMTKTDAQVLFDLHRTGLERATARYLFSGSLTIMNLLSLCHQSGDKSASQSRIADTSSNRADKTQVFAARLRSFET